MHRVVFSQILPAPLKPRRLRPGLMSLLLCTAPALALDLNLATEAELDGLSGVGPAFTARVMQARAERPFLNWADFMQRVKGVREPTALKLSRQGARIQQQTYTPPLPRAARD